MTVICVKCGVRQDPAKPTCTHLAGRKGGTSTKRKLGLGHFKKIGKKGGKSGAR